jgi:hypothetical protein
MSIRRIPLKQWKIEEDNGFVQLIVNGMSLFSTISMGWRVSLETSNVFPEMLGLITHKGVATPVWLYKGHLWLGSIYLLLFLAFTLTRVRENSSSD